MTSLEIKHVPKGWGHEKWIVNTKEYCGKLLFFNEGKRCSWHYHQLKDETFYLQSGLLSLYHGWDNDLATADLLVLEPGDKLEVTATGSTPRVDAFCTVEEIFIPVGGA